MNARPLFSVYNLRQIGMTVLSIILSIKGDIVHL